MGFHFGNFLESLLDDLGMTNRAKVAKDMGIDPKTIYNWLDSPELPTRSDAPVLLPTYLYIPVPVFRAAAEGRKELPPEYRDRERWLAEREKRNRIAVTNELLAKQRAEKFPGRELAPTRQQPTPIYADVTATGIAEQPDTRHIGRNDFIPFRFEQFPDAFALRIRGDSMSPVYHDGEHIVVAPTQLSELRNGEEAWVQFEDDRAAFKRVFQLGDGELMLAAFNDLYPPTTINAEEIKRVCRIIGTFRFKVSR